MDDSFARAATPAGANQAPSAAIRDVQQVSATTDVADCVARLDELVAKSVSFLQGQLHRLDEAYVELGELQNSPVEAGQNQQDLSEQQAAWERQQVEEAKRINEQLDYLTQAWSLLEEEQRLQMTEGHSAPRPRMEEHSGPEYAPQPAAAPVDLVDPPIDLMSSAAEIQFQKLKREIRQHARRSR